MGALDDVLGGFNLVTKIKEGNNGKKLSVKDAADIYYNLGEDSPPEVLTALGKTKTSPLADVVGSTSPKKQRDLESKAQQANIQFMASKAGVVATPNFKTGVLEFKDSPVSGREQAKDEAEKTAKTFSSEAELRKEWQNHPVTKNTDSLSQQASKIVTAAKDPTAAGDMGVIFGFMKMQDPQSTVREGEYATAQNAAGVPDRIINAYNNAKNGIKLAPDQRADFVNQARKLYDAQLAQQSRIDNQYSGIAKQYKFDSKRIINPFGKLNIPSNQPGKNQVMVTNGKETLMIDKADLKNAIADGYKQQ